MREKERAGETVADVELLVGLYQNSVEADIQRVADKVIAAGIPINGHVEEHPVRFPPGKVEESFCFRKKLGRFDRPGKDCIRSAARALFDCTPGVRTDHDNEDSTLLRILPEVGAELLTAHPGHIERDDDQVQADRAMDLKHLIGCGRREDTHVRPA